MTRLLATLMALVPLLAGCSSSDAGTPRAAPTADRGQAGCPPEVDEALSAWEEAGFSGSIAITTGGEPDCLAAYGPDGSTTARLAA